MTEAFLLVGVGSLLTVGGAGIGIGVLALQDARRSIKRFEERMGYFREEQTRLLEFLREEHRGLKKELEWERDLRLEAQQEVERLNREHLLLPQDQGQLAETLDLERAKRLEAERQARQERERQEKEHRARREAERRSDHSERELQELRKAQRDREAQREGSPLAGKAMLESLPGSRGFSTEKPRLTQVHSQEARESGRTPRPAGFPEMGAPEPVQDPRKDKRLRRAVWMPHPDDSAELVKAPVGQTRVRSDAPTEMFRKHYDKYLENYQGYLELAEGLYRIRDNGEAPSGSMSGREWEERFRRVSDGIERTTARLDILEGHNPELVTDARVSHRARLAKKYSELERSMRDRGTS